MKSRQLCVRLRSLGIPKDQTHEILRSVERWIAHSGSEWTVERLKSLKLEFITRLAGQPVLAPRFKRNKQGLPAGVWSYLFKRTNTKSQINSTLQALMLYSNLVGQNMTQKQREKFFGSMLSDDKTGLDSTLKLFPICNNKWKVHLQKTDPFLLYCTAPGKTAMSSFGTSIRGDDALGQFMAFCHSDTCRLAVSTFPKVFEDVIPSNLYSYLTNPLWLYLKKDPVKGIQGTRTAVGKLGFIQEPGYKLRAVANPNAIWQAALDPLCKLLLRFLKEGFPTDCTHDQASGVQAIQSWLRAGKVCYSVDLSDATNLMPRYLQIQLLKQSVRTFIHEDDLAKFDSLVEAFDFVSGAPWYYKDTNGEGKTACFKRGQPLGLKPSFASFAYAHNVIMWGICKKLGLRDVDTFRILGDDIVISDPEAHRLYLETLKNLGAKVSSQKCLTSAKVAEFAGCVITADTIYQPLKWRDVTDASFLDVCRQCGQKSRQWLSKYQRKVLDAIAPLPVELGGFGWNSKGIPLEERLSSPLATWFLDRTQLPEKVVVRYRTLDSLLHEFQTNIMRNEDIAPFFSNEQIGLFPYLNSLMSEEGGASLPTRESGLDYWHSDLVNMSRAATGNNKVVRPPHVQQVVNVEEWNQIRFSDTYGVLIPEGHDLIGDPRKWKFRSLLQALDWSNGHKNEKTVLATALLGKKASLDPRAQTYLKLLRRSKEASRSEDSNLCAENKMKSSHPQNAQDLRMEVSNLRPERRGPRR